MATMWSLFFTFCWYLPWVPIALVGGLAMRRAPSRGLMLQTLAAGALFLLGMGEWSVLWLMRVVNVPLRAINAAGTIFDFLLFVSLVAFAMGFCVERLGRRRGGDVPLAVTARRVE